MIRPSISYNNVLLLSMLFFSLLDLYFAHSDASCTNSIITNTRIGFGLGQWLQISSYTNIIFILLPFMSRFLETISPQMLIFYMIFSAVYVFFRTIWVILGSIIFWGHLWEMKVCSWEMNLYMWINLVYSFGVLGTLCYNQQQVFTTTYNNKTSVI